MESHKYCNNCETPRIGAYCHNCGQKESHRITLKHLIMHDLMHGVWHFDKGLLYTIKESFLRPGYMAMNYINGKRIRYYNIFYLLLLIFGINILLAHYYNEYHHIKEAATTRAFASDKVFDLSYIIGKYSKLFLFLTIPIFAISAIVSFRKLKYNLAEQAIIAGSVLLTGALWVFIYKIYLWLSWGLDGMVWNIIEGMLILAFLIWPPMQVYYQVTRRELSLLGFIWRMVSWYAWCLFQAFLVLLVIAAFTGKTDFRIN